MQITLDLYQPKELKAASDFLAEIAKLRELDLAQVGLILPPAEPEKPAKAKKSKPAPAEVSQADPEPAEKAAPTSSQSKSHDDVRKLIGELSQSGKRQDAINVIRGYMKDGKPLNSVADIPADLVVEIHDKLEALK